MKNHKEFLQPARFTLILVVLVIVIGLSFQVVQPDFGKLVVNAPKAEIMLNQLLSPDIITRRSLGTIEVSVTVPVPCGSATESEPVTSGPRITVYPGCAAVKDMILLKGEGLAPNVEVLLHWTLPSGQDFSVSTAKIETDANGTFEREVEIRPIVTTKDGMPSQS
jgi:hypothetical protein